MEADKLTVKHQIAIPCAKRGASSDDDFGRMLRETMPEWFSPEDDEAFGDP